jgi:SAM-dependent methyltransferase
VLNEAGAAFRAGRLEEAGDLARQALALAPDHAGGRSLSGVIALLRGDVPAARADLERAVALAPDEPEYRAQLVQLLLEQGQADAALRILDEAKAPEAGELAALRARALERSGRPGEALAVYEALVDDPEQGSVAQARLLALAGEPTPGLAEADRERVLRRLLGSPGVDPATLSVPLARLLLARHDPAGARAPRPEGPARDDLFLEALGTLYFTEPDMEVFLTRLRRQLLESCVAEGRVPAAWQPLMGALAVHNLRNESVFAIGEREAGLLEDLERRLEEALAGRPEPARVTGLFLLVALYRTPDSIPGASALAGLPSREWPAPARSLIRLAFEEPAREADQAAAIATVGDIGEREADSVRVMYEQHPYPRWDRLGPVRTATVAESLARQLPRFRPPAILEGAEVPVLIAGCGTGRHALRAAVEYRNARVTAIDISRRSLAYATRRARELGVDNVTFLQADLFDLPRLDTRFPVVETIGTLETLNDPEAGWRVLVEMLAPGGVMYVGSYSETARRPVVAARRRIRELGLAGTPEDMRAFRERVLAGEFGAHGRVLMSCGDFYSLSGIRDFLFHVSERRFTIRQLAGLWQRLGLEFLGFHPVPGAVMDEYRRRYPTDPEGLDLDNWIAFEENEPETFCRLMNLSMLYYWLQNGET